MPAPHYADLPTASRHYIDEASWNLVKAALVALGQTGTPLFSALPTTTKPYIDQPNFDALADAIATGGTEVSASLNFPAIPRGEHQDLTITVAGAVAGRPVYCGAPAALEEGLSVFCWVSAANTVTVRVSNSKADGTEVDPAPGTYVVIVF